jgi:hypothetical protein
MLWLKTKPNVEAAYAQKDIFEGAKSTCKNYKRNDTVIGYRIEGTARQI